MEIKVAITKFESTEWYSINVDINTDTDSIKISHLCDISTPANASKEISLAIEFAKGLLNGGHLPVVSTSDEGIDQFIPLSIDGFKPVETKIIQADLDLPDRSEFELSAKYRQISFLASKLKLEVDPSDANVDQVLKALKSEANLNLLPIYTDKINYLSSLLNENVHQNDVFSEDLVNQLQLILSRCDSLPSDVLISDSESLAEQLSFNLPAEQLSQQPYKYFQTLHIEELERSVANIDMQTTEWRQMA